MLIKFDVAGTPVEFYRNWFTGRVKLRTAGAEHALQSPFDPRTHFSTSTTQQWRCRIGDHHIVIEKERPLLFAGFRPQSFRVLVDNQVVASQRGY